MTSPYAGIDMPKPPKGYRLAKWGEEAIRSMWWCRDRKEWIDFGVVEAGWYNNAPLSIFAIPKPRIRIPLEPTT